MGRRHGAAGKRVMVTVEVRDLQGPVMIRIRWGIH